MKTNVVIPWVVLFISVLFLQPVRAVNPPGANLVLWLNAGVGVSTNANGTVATWADQSGSALPHDGTATNSPTLGTYEFVNGPQPVVSFSGVLDGIVLTNVAGLELTNLTIYIVTADSVSSVSKAFISVFDRNENGYVLGISDGVFDQIKWFTLPPGDSLESDGYTLTPGSFSLITADFNGADGSKSLFMSTNLVANDGGLATPAYSTNETAVLGDLFPYGGQSFEGSIAEILIYSQVSASQNVQVWQYLNEKYFGMGSGPVVITHQPVSQTVVEGQSVVFDVGFDGAGPVDIQWYENAGGTNIFLPISGATNVAYTNLNVYLADQGSVYQVRLSNSVPSGVISSNVVLTVEHESSPLAIISAREGYLRNNEVTVTFDRAVSSATALKPGNYSINDGLTVAQVGNWANSSNVILTLSGNIPPHTSPLLTVNNVTDLANEPIPANSQVTVTTPVSAVLPPTSNGDLVLWLSADNGAGIDANGYTITNWTDLSGAGSEHNASTIVGNPQLAMANFPTGPYPVVRFDGGSGFILDNGQDLDLGQFSIFVVGSVNTAELSQEFIANWPGFAFGMSDVTSGRIKFVTIDGSGNVDSLEPVYANLGNHVPAQLTGTYNGDKTYDVDGVPEASETGVGLEYYAPTATLGMLTPGGGQFLFGDIAEILVYSTVDPTEVSNVEYYLYEKYLQGPPSVVAATWDPLDSSYITVRFSVFVTAATAGNMSNYALNSGNTITSATLNPDGFTVTLTTAEPLSGTVTNILTVSNVQDTRSSYVIAPNSQVTLTAAASPSVTMVWQGASLMLTWPGLGILQSAPSLTGPWSDVAGTTNGIVIVPSISQEFFRLRGQ